MTFEKSYLVTAFKSFGTGLMDTFKPAGDKIYTRSRIKYQLLYLKKIFNFTIAKHYPSMLNFSKLREERICFLRLLI